MTFQQPLRVPRAKQAQGALPRLNPQQKKTTSKARSALHCPAFINNSHTTLADRLTPTLHTVIGSACILQAVCYRSLSSKLKYMVQPTISHKLGYFIYSFIFWLSTVSKYYEMFVYNEAKYWLPTDSIYSIYSNIS